MFSFEVEYLTGRIVASERHNRDSAEWPPHPGRLFSALVAAYAECDLGAPERSALEWLERQPPPSLSVGEADQRSVVTIFVPVNDKSVPDKIPVNGFSAAQVAEGLKVLPERRNRQPRSLPSATPHHPLVHFLWSTADPKEVNRFRPALERLSSHVSYLGHSSSLVRVAVCDDPPTPTLVPAGEGEDGDMLLRVPTPGRLDDLEETYRRRGQPSAGATAHSAMSPEPCCHTPMTFPGGSWNVATHRSPSGYGAVTTAPP